MAENEMNKRRRGRPKGASRLNPADHLTLMTMADLILSKTMLPTTAMRRLGILGEADTRRLQRKWKASGAHYLEGARTRQQVLTARPAAASKGYSPGLKGLAAHMDVLRHLTDSPVMRTMREEMERAQKLMEAARVGLDNPAVRAIQGYMDSPAMRAVQDHINSPAMRALREMERTQRLIRGF